MKKIKVSVILPVFDPGEGIRKCIESLRRQTLKDIEMIFVDDCGSDGAMDLVRAAAGEDERIRILENPSNQGAGMSRNRGIEAAEGEYLAFIDPDDFVAENFFELLYGKAKALQAEIVKGSCVALNEKNEELKTGQKLNLHIRKGLSGGTDPAFLFTYEHCTAIYLRSRVMRTGARYGASSYGEDNVFLLRVCCGVRSLELEERAHYYYVMRSGSSDSTFSPRRMEGELVSLREKMDFIASHYSYEKSVDRYLVQNFLRGLKVHAGCAARKGQEKTADAFLKELKDVADSLPFAGRIAEKNRTVGAFIKYGANISLDPFGSEWKKDRWADHYGAVRRVVDFICDHPGLAREYRDYLWKAFDQAVACRELHAEAGLNRREVWEALKKQADRLPDKRILTDDYAAMKLYIDHGADLFRIRDTAAGKLIKKVLKKIRKNRR